MEIRQFRHFLAVAERLNFRSAAEQVHLTQQAVSKSILQLEHELGVQLFERGRQSVLLTESGKMLIPYVRDIIADIKRFEDAVADVVGNRHGQLRIGATPTLLEEIVPTTLHAFLEEYPDTRVVVERGDFPLLRDMMLQGQLDMVMSTEPEEMPAHLIASQVIAVDHNVVVVRKDHPLLDRATATAADLSGYPRASIHFPRGEHYLERVFAEEQLTVPWPTLRAGSTSFAISWTEQSDCWFVAPYLRVLRGIREGRLAIVPMQLDDDSWNVILATRRHSKQSRLQAAYIGQVRACLDALSAAAE